MNVGELLLLLGTLAALAALVSRMVSRAARRERMDLIADVTTVSAFIFITVAFSYLVFLFLTSDFTFLYVWSNSSSDLSPVYKVSAVWAGGAGSILVWVWIILLIALVELRKSRKKGTGRAFEAVFQTSLLAVLLILMAVLLSMGLFEETVTSPDTAWRLDLYPYGMGLRLSFQTPEMILHPIAVFAGYSMCLAVFSASVGHFVSKDPEWISVTRRWSKPAWLFVTLGIGIGAIWAYYVIGYGGYWSWDPVETASLMIWLIVTAFLHAQARYQEHNEYRTIAPALGMLCFVSVVLTTFVTRAGGLWLGSVHTFNAPSELTAGNRFIDILVESPQVAGIFLLLVILTALTAFFSISKARKRNADGGQAKPKGAVNERWTMLLGVSVMLITIAVMLVLLLKNVNATQSLNYDEFNQKISVFAVAIMISMTLCLVWRRVSSRTAITVSAILVAISVAMALGAFFLGFSVIAAFVIPSAVTVAVALTIKIAVTKRSRSPLMTARSIAPQLVHLGVALILIGYVFSSNLSIGSGASGIDVSAGESFQIGDYTVRLTRLDTALVRTPPSFAYDTATSATFEISRNGGIVEENVTVSNLYTTFGGSLSIVHEGVHIHKTIIDDLYLNFDRVDDATIAVHAKVVPLINILWLGLLLLLSGISALTVVDWRISRPRNERAHGPTPLPRGKTSN